LLRQKGFEVCGIYVSNLVREKMCKKISHDNFR
jgi:hypothetical protein